MGTSMQIRIQLYCIPLCFCTQHFVELVRPRIPLHTSLKRACMTNPQPHLDFDRIFWRFRERRTRVKPERTLLMHTRSNFTSAMRCAIPPSLFVIGADMSPIVPHFTNLMIDKATRLLYAFDSRPSFHLDLAQAENIHEE
jgi:hypothetical protein